MKRSHAFAIHLGLSVLICLPLVLLTSFVWYPGPFLEAMGGLQLISIVVICDVIIGPVITLIIFQSQKKSLKFDMAVIAILQTAAYCYGAYVIFEARPVFVVHYKDGMDVTSASRVDRSRLEELTWLGKTLSLTGPVLVSAELPKDKQEHQALIFAAISGIDLNSFPQYFIPYSEGAKDAARYSHPFAELKKHNAHRQKEIDALGRELLNTEENEIRYIPVRGAKKDFVAIVSAKGNFIKYYDFYPW